MSDDPLADLSAAGVAVWLDDLSRERLRSGNLAGLVQGVLGRTSGEERQYDFTGAGTVLLQSSEIAREDPEVLRLVESQTALLTNSQAGSLGQRLIARAQQQQ